MNVQNLPPPLTDLEVEKLTAGDEVEITGTIYSARDAAHARLTELIESGNPTPMELQGQIIYYMGPTPARSGKCIGAAGPTSSYRMDSYTSLLLQNGIKAVIGKGVRSEEVKNSLKDFNAVYLVALGGGGALLSKHITHSEVIAYPELGPEAICRLNVESFPVTVCYDCHGGDLYDKGRKMYRKG